MKYLKKISLLICLLCGTTSLYAQDCLPPGNIIVTDTTATTATITWDDQANAVSYLIHMWPKGTGTSFSFPADVNSFTFTDLEPGTQYGFNIKSFCDGETTRSAKSGNTTFITKGEATCVPIDGVPTHTVFENIITLDWSSIAIQDVTGYRIRYWHPNSNGMTVVQVSEPSAILVLEPNIDYRFEINTVCNDLTSSDWGQRFFITTGSVVRELWATRSGNWEDEDLWSETEGGSTFTYPPNQYDIVHINGYDITVDPDNSGKAAPKYCENIILQDRDDNGTFTPAVLRVNQLNARLIVQGEIQLHRINAEGCQVIVNNGGYLEIQEPNN